MATLAGNTGRTGASDHRFFLIVALLQAAVIFAGFSLQLAMGRSSFSAPLLFHAHAVVFMGWVVLYVTQVALVAGGSLALHKRLGWLAAAWLVPMTILGPMITLARIQEGRAPFFFLPQHFLVANPLNLASFVGLTVAAVAMRRRTDWHRRLHLVAMSAILGPGFGRLLPMPLMTPYAWQASVLIALVFPVAGMVWDWRRTGRVHRAWWWGTGAFLAIFALGEVIAVSPIGAAVYGWAVAGTPGAAVPGLEFGSPPPAA